jgi:hypothetical protein
MPFSIRPHRRLPVNYSVTYNAGAFLKLSAAFFLGLVSLITLLVLTSGSAEAEWMSITKTEEGTTVYADPDTIRRKGDLVKMWELYDFKIIRTVAGDSYF